MAFVRPPLTAPGVYVQEVLSGNRTVVGVATSITAFLGRTARGPVDVPTSVTSFEDFVKLFGGLSRNHALTYAVEDFFLNGGTQAIIVRLFEGDTAPAVATVERKAEDGFKPASDADLKKAQDALDTAKTAQASAQKDYDAAKEADKKLQASDASNADKTKSTKALKKLEENLEKANVAVEEAQAELSELQGTMQLNLVAANPGTWANGMTYIVDTDGITDMVRSRFANPEWDAGDLFNLTLSVIGPDGREMKEVYPSVSVIPEAGERYIGNLLQHKSLMARLVDGDPPKTPQKGKDSEVLTVEMFTEGFEHLERVDMVNIVCIPPDDDVDGQTNPEVYTEAVAFCEKRRAILVVDAPNSWEDDPGSVTAETFAKDLGISAGADSARFAAVYFPRMMRRDPLRGGFPRRAPVCGAMAGIYSRTDSVKGVWSAPAGYESGIVGAAGLSKTLTDVENGVLNQRGINCLRSFPATGPIVWGARTMRGADVLSDDFKYLQVRRVLDFIEVSLQRGTGWAVFENNDEPLWAELRLSIGNFMADLFRQGAFAGGSAKDAFFVHCDASTTTPNDQNLGIVNVVVGYAPLKPAEFVILYFQQIAGQAA